MSITKKIDADIITAMKAKEEHRLTTLRRVKSALKSKAIDKRADLTDQEENAILTTLIKQRKESAESFLKGNRPELAAKEEAEITMIEAYLPRPACEDEVRAAVQAVIGQLTVDGVRPGPKDMGTAMKVVQQHLFADGLRADGKVVSEIVRSELAKQ
jgi:uncharacterized protein